MKRSFLDGYSTGATRLAARESREKEEEKEKEEKEASWQIEGGTGEHRYAWILVSLATPCGAMP